MRDIDVLQNLAHKAGASVAVSIATMDEGLARTIEPTVAPPGQRLRAVKQFANAGIRVNVALAPILPQITDGEENLDAVVRAAREAGAASVWHNTLYLHEVTREAFFAYLRAHRPGLIAHYATLYRGKYAPREVHDEIDERVKRSQRAHPNRAGSTIQPRGPLQISLL